MLLFFVGCLYKPSPNRSFGIDCTPSASSGLQVASSRLIRFLRSSVSFLCLAIKKSLQINIYFNINLEGCPSLLAQNYLLSLLNLKINILILQYIRSTTPLALLNSFIKSVFLLSFVSILLFLIQL